MISKRALRNLVALRGQKSMKKRNLRIQGRMQINKGNVLEGFKSNSDTAKL